MRHFVWSSICDLTSFHFSELNIQLLKPMVLVRVCWQYLLLRAYVFQTWYNFDRRETADMRTRLQVAFGESNRSGNASRNPTAAQDELAYSTATNLEREDLSQFAIDDYREMIEYQERIKKNAESSIFSHDW